MMSYLWILLLGSLLAANTKAQDKAGATVAPGEDAAAPEPTIEDAKQEEEPTVAQDAAQDETPEEEGTPKPDSESESAAEEPTTSQPEAQDTGTDAPQTTAPAEVADPDPTVSADDSVPDTTPSTPEETATPKDDDEQPAVPEEQPTSTDETTEAPSQEETTPKAVDASEEDPIVQASAPEVHAEKDTPADAEPTTQVPPPPKSDDGGLDLADAIDNKVPEEDTVRKEGGRSGGSATHTSEATGEAGTPEAQEGSSNSLVGILSTVGVALVGAVTGFYTYQKKKFCFKNRQAADPEAARKADAAEAQSDPQVLSNLLNSS